MKLAFDIEADGLQLDATKIHCIVFRDVVTHKEWLLSSQVITMSFIMTPLMK